MFNSALYKDSPPWAQELMVAGRSLARSAAREGHAFRRMREEIERTQWLAGDALRDFAFRHLRSTIEAAAADVPYWRALFKRLELSAHDMALPDGLAELPLLTKAEVRAAGDEIREAGDHQLLRPGRAVLVEGRVEHDRSQRRRGARGWRLAARPASRR